MHNGERTHHKDVDNLFFDVLHEVTGMQVPDEGSVRKTDDRR